MIRLDGYYMSEGFQWADWHAGHKFEGVNYELIKFLNKNEVITPSSSSIEIEESIFEDRMNYADRYRLIDDKSLEIIFNPESKWSVTKLFTILSSEILLDENLKEYKFVPVNTSF